MGWKIEHLEPEDIVRVTAYDRITAEDTWAQVEEGIDLILRRQTEGTLIDYSGAKLEMEVTDIFKMPELFEIHALPRKTKIAVVLPADPQNMHKYTFFDDVATNRGYQVKLFWEPGEAMKWLRDGQARVRKTERQE